ncbi:MAG: hypothetical protein WBA89_29505, partial [Microcoleus sp.]|uniref:hypothetical protein n=1 Tax=Microcoleus sp. TaxID=44472 RepID=UPI003C724E72
CTDAREVWINRRSPVYSEFQRRKWQEFYRCQCGGVWWAWSSDRPPSELVRPDESSNESSDEDDDDF